MPTRGPPQIVRALIAERNIWMWVKLLSNDEAACPGRGRDDSNLCVRKSTGKDVCRVKFLVIHRALRPFIHWSLGQCHSPGSSGSLSKPSGLTIFTTDLFC